MKSSQDNWLPMGATQNSESSFALRQIAIPTGSNLVFWKAWQFICRLGASMETFTLIPITALVVLPVFLYFMLTRGYCDVLFHPKK